jgi:hypothetical protein
MPKTPKPRALKARFTFGVEIIRTIEARFQRWASLERDRGAAPKATDERRAVGAKQKRAL